MITAEDFLSRASAAGVDFYTAVPCSFLTPLINAVISRPGLGYIGATSEGEAVAIAAGAWLAGRSTVVMCQNSGLGNAVNPLVSLNWPFRIPTLLVTTWRGEPGLKDEPQHDLMGQITTSILDVMRIRNSILPASAADLDHAFSAAVAHMAAEGLPYAFVMRKDTVADAALNQTEPAPMPAGALTDLREFGAVRPSRYACLEQLLAVVPDRAGIVATTGKCGRELFTLEDREQHLYQVGSMGCASAMGLGVALNTSRPVVVLDGDGAALMKLGNLATIGAHAPENLVHVVLDNGVHDSTGGQATVSASVDFAGVAVACGYRSAYRTDSLAGIEAALTAAFAARGPVMVHARIAPGSLEKLGRPTIKPDAVARRFRAFVTAA